MSEPIQATIVDWACWIMVVLIAWFLLFSRAAGMECRLSVERGAAVVVLLLVGALLGLRKERREGK